MVIDYRAANKHIRSVAFAAKWDIPTIERILLDDTNQWACTIDLKDMFYQVPLYDPKGLLNFAYQGAQYQWKACPQGYKNSPACVSEPLIRTLEKVPSLPNIHVVYYVDDILITGTTQTEVQKVTEQVQATLSTDGWNLSLPKSVLTATSTFQFLAFTVEKEQLRHSTYHPLTHSFPLGVAPPRREVQHVLGVINYHKQFLPAALLPQLSVLQRYARNVKTPWTPEAEQAVSSLAAWLGSGPTLARWNPTNPIEITLTVSSDHVAVTVSQENLPVHNQARKLSGPEYRYGPVGIAMLAVQCALPWGKSATGTLKGPHVELLPYLTFTPAPQFQGAPTTWERLVYQAQEVFGHWALKSSSTTAPTEPGAIAQLSAYAPWIVSDGGTSSSPRAGMLCAPCNTLKVKPLDFSSSAQKAEAEGILLAASHIVAAHPKTRVVLGVDSSYCVSILVGEGRPTAHEEAWAQITQLAAQSKMPWFVTHCPSHRSNRNPLHSSLNLQLQEYKCNTSQVNIISCSNPFVTWLHDEWGHLPARALHQLLTDRGTRTSSVSRQQCTQAIQGCLSCQWAQVTNKPVYAHGAYSPKHFSPGKTWQMDLIGPLPGAKRYPKGLVIVDLGSRQLMCSSLRRSTAPAVSVALLQVIAAWGAPEEIQTNKGPPFTSKAIDQTVSQWGGHLHIHLPYHPQSSGVVEVIGGYVRFNPLSYSLTLQHIRGLSLGLEALANITAEGLRRTSDALTILAKYAEQNRLLIQTILQKDFCVALKYLDPRFKGQCCLRLQPRWNNISAVANQLSSFAVQIRKEREQWDWWQAQWSSWGLGSWAQSIKQWLITVAIILVAFLLGIAVVKQLIQRVVSALPLQARYSSIPLDSSEPSHLHYLDSEDLYLDSKDLKPLWPWSLHGATLSQAVGSARGACLLQLSPCWILFQ
uniref:ribonuclease H n=1 Tax=Chelydra serpentina TaxID=8475 RepID=A0A8C3S5W4_CHESE